MTRFLCVSVRGMVDIYPPGVRIIGDGVMEIDNWTDLYTPDMNLTGRCLIGADCEAVSLKFKPRGFC
jgi:hypothetical protein